MRIAKTLLSDLADAQAELSSLGTHATLLVLSFGRVTSMREDSIGLDSRNAFCFIPSFSVSAC